MKVTKYSASGNDFIIFIAQDRANRSELAKKGSGPLGTKNWGFGRLGLWKLGLRFGWLSPNKREGYWIFGRLGNFY